MTYPLCDELLHTVYTTDRLDKCNHQGSEFDGMSFFFPCEIDDAIEHINLGYAAQAPNIAIL